MESFFEPRTHVEIERAELHSSTESKVTKAYLRGSPVALSFGIKMSWKLRPSFWRRQAMSGSKVFGGRPPRKIFFGLMTLFWGRLRGFSPTEGEDKTEMSLSVILVISSSYRLSLSGWEKGWDGCEGEEGIKCEY